MSNLFLHSRADQNQEQNASSILSPASHTPLPIHLEERLSAAYPRLLRLAQASGVPADAVENVVQEALVSAWRHLDHLRVPERFDAWLDRICRNAAYQYHRQLPKRELSLSQKHPETDGVPAFDFPDFARGDPLEELDRQALSTLLDRAMSFLAPEARLALEAYYLAEIPQQELALRLGVTIGTLESRLHRARKHLRRVLIGDLRAEAEDLGLVRRSPMSGWHETRLWCNLCGRRRLLGTFEPCGDGRVNFRLNCPECSPKLDFDNLSSNGIVPLNDLHSFRPAFKRSMQVLTTEFMQALKTGQRICTCCGTPTSVRVVNPDEGAFFLPRKFWIGLDCPTCGLRLWTLDDFVCWHHPAMQRFLAEHPRRLNEPDTVVEYAGQAAICFRFSDPTSTAGLAVLVHHHTLQILATFP